MACFTNLFYMHGYAFCDVNCHKAKTEYRLRYLLCRKPNHALLATVHQKLRETSSFRNVCKMGQDRRSATTEEYIVDRVEEDPNVSLCLLVREAGISQNKVMNVLHENLYHPYHFTLIEELCCPDFQKWVTFCC